MSKRPPIDLMALTVAEAQPMPEAIQRSAATRPAPTTPPAVVEPAKVRTEDLVSLGFKVPPAFRKRFRQRAAMADLSHLDLLHEALAAWEEKHRLK